MSLTSFTTLAIIGGAVLVFGVSEIAKLFGM